MRCSPRQIRKYTAVVCTLVLLKIVRADVTFSDLPGKYRNDESNLAFCKAELELIDATTTLSGNRILFDGSPACSSSLIITQTKASDANSYGTIVTSGNSYIRCGSSSVRFTLFKPLVNTVMTDATTGIDSYMFKKGVTYVQFVGNPLLTVGTCIYVKLNAAQDSASRDPSSSDSSSENTATEPVTQDQDVKPSKPGDNEHPTVVAWAWIGPLIGAAATIAAALIGVYCVRKHKRTDPDPSQSAYTSSHASAAYQHAPPAPTYQPTYSTPQYASAQPAYGYSATTPHYQY